MDNAAHRSAARPRRRPARCRPAALPLLPGCLACRHSLLLSLFQLLLFAHQLQLLLLPACCLHKPPRVELRSRTDDSAAARPLWLGCLLRVLLLRREAQPLRVPCCRRLVAAGIGGCGAQGQGTLGGTAKAGRCGSGSGGSRCSRVMGQELAGGGVEAAPLLQGGVAVQACGVRSREV